MEPIGGDVRRELRRFGPQGRMSDLVTAWPRAVGAEIARCAWPARFQRDGTLVVHARDAVWAFELTQRAAEISSRLPEAPTLKVVPGPLPELEQVPRRGDPEPPRVTPEQAREAARWASEIADDQLRELVARAARASLARAAADRRF